MSESLDKDHPLSHLSGYCRKWNLSEAKLLVSTSTSYIYRANQGSIPVIVKILNAKGKQFEAKGATVLSCFNGCGAVRLLNSEEGAHLLEYIDGPTLRQVVANGNDAEATEVVCDVIEKLHSFNGPVPDELILMERNFLRLFEMASKPMIDEIYIAGAKLAERLIATEQERRVLHGDIHHENILKSSERGWLAIDPQSLVGERTYEVANTFYNPDGFLELALNPDAIMRRRETFARRLNLDAQRILEFAFAYGCLSACWSIEDGQSPIDTLKIARKIRDRL